MSPGPPEDTDTDTDSGGTTATARTGRRAKRANLSRRSKRIRCRPAMAPLALSHEKGTGSVLYMPPPLLALRHAAPVVLESVVVPLIAYYCALAIAGFRGALIGALAWSYLLVVRRLLKRQRVSTMLMLGTGLLTVRTAVSFATGSLFLYFIQPTASAFLASALLVVSAIVGRPFTQRFTHDFCPLSPEFLARERTHRFFVRVSFLWAATMFLNGVAVLVMLLLASSNAFAIERSAITMSLTFVAIFLSVVWFTRTMRSDGITVRFGTAPAPTAAAARRRQLHELEGATSPLEAA